MAFGTMLLLPHKPAFFSDHVYPQIPTSYRLGGPR